MSRNISEPARTAWDAWFSEQLGAAREGLGEAFDAAHDAAPPWRFVDGPGRFGQGWRAGAFAPSVDAVGRRFFVVMSAEALDEPSAGRGLSIAAAIEATLYEALAERLDADAAALRGGEAAR
ncbi:MAG TPA: type VI secretion system-associated protein TagF, partial [Caulobacteraceae bacterium]|nr:type VI secretion system-associated protein TagF [Caulobacteraceae bacterium]